MRAAIGFLFPGTPDNVYKGGVSTELNGALGNREDILRLCKHYLGIGAIARANLSVTDSCHGGLYLKLVSAIVLYSLGRDILKDGIEPQVLQRTNGNLHRHALYESSHLGLVNISTENQVVHIGYRRNGCTIVEGVAQHHCVSDFYGHVEYESRNG